MISSGLCGAGKETITLDNILSAQARESLRTVDVGIWQVVYLPDKPPKFYADECMDDLLGISAPVTAEERYTLFLKGIHPDDMELFLEYAQMLSETRTEIVYRYIHPTRGEMLVRCGGRRDPAVTEYVSIVGTHQDISDVVRLEPNKIVERRLSEQNLTLRQEQEAKEDYYRRLLDEQNCGLIVYTLPEHEIQHMNAEARRIYGFSTVEDAKAHFIEVFRKIRYTDPATEERLLRLGESDETVDYDCVLNQGGEAECHITAKSKRVILPDGRKAVITTLLDISDVVLLRRALRRAEEGSQAKSTFLLAMSHDLRTPMNAILGYAQLMEEHWDDEAAAREYLRKQKLAGRYLLTLIDSVLEVSRIENNRERMHEAPWSIRELDESMDVLLQNDIRRKNLTVVRSEEIPQPVIFCDGVKVRAVWMNLVSNAVKYTQNGGKITLGIYESVAPDGAVTLRLSVEDTGVGIGEEYLPHIFEAFSRERDSSESGIMGTGLGLSIVRSFVEMMNGTITVRSRVGEGSGFYVELPLRTVPAELLKQSAAKRVYDLAGKRVLIAEDNELNAEITATVLHDAKILTDVAADGEEALHMLTAAPAGYYDAILMDVQMPRMDGYEATRRIRALPDKRAHTPIIAMTANAFAEDREAALTAGMDDYIAKPVEKDRALATLGEAIERGRTE